MANLPGWIKIQVNSKCAYLDATKVSAIIPSLQGSGSVIYGDFHGVEYGLSSDNSPGCVYAKMVESYLNALDEDPVDIENECTVEYLFDHTDTDDA